MQESEVYILWYINTNYAVIIYGAVKVKQRRPRGGLPSL